RRPLRAISGPGVDLGDRGPADVLELPDHLSDREDPRRLPTRPGPVQPARRHHRPDAARADRSERPLGDRGFLQPGVDRDPDRDGFGDPGGEPAPFPRDPAANGGAAVPLGPPGPAYAPGPRRTLAARRSSARLIRSRPAGNASRRAVSSSRRSGAVA